MIDYEQTIRLCKNELQIQNITPARQPDYGQVGCAPIILRGYDFVSINTALNTFSQIISMGFRRYLDTRKPGRAMHVSSAMPRLTSPSNIRYGGYSADRRGFFGIFRPRLNISAGAIFFFEIRLRGLATRLRSPSSRKTPPVFKYRLF